MKEIKILWVCNKAPCIVNKIWGNKANPAGGWLDTVCEKLLQMDWVSLCTVFMDNSEYENAKDNFSFYSFIENKCANRFYNIIKDFAPDIIHIWGTEYRHSLEAIYAAEQLKKSKRCVVSIQGLVSLIGKYHYTEGLPNIVVNRFTVRDVLRKNIYQDKKDFVQRGNFEIEALKRVSHIIGRTDWDKAAAEMYNPNAEYHFCNETLRESFYKNKWDIAKIQRHSIFVSQCNYPVKGFHYILEAMPEILKHYPDTHIYTTGIDLLNLSLKRKILISSYHLYLLELINKFDLREHISFLGVLPEQQMCEQYLKANVFVSASTIENSPNSVGEAMLLGCPVVSSDVGGVKNMLTHEKDGYVYQSSAPYMLAYYVKKLFSEDKIALEFSENAKKHAAQTHDIEKNMTSLMAIYQKIMLNNLHK